MEETDDWDNNSNCSSLITSSTDSDCGSVLSVILNPTQTQDDGPETFTYAAPLPVGSYALASCVYVLIDKGRSMSADMRVMWYLKRLGTIQMVDDDLDVESPEQCKIMSFIPREENLDKDGFANSIFVMDAYTRVYFLTAVYNMVYCLDMSPSNCSVDIQRCHVMLDEMIVALRRSIEGFIRPFIVPGSDKIVFEPQVYVTVIVHTPFYTSPAQQVLVQGWLINNRNFQEFIKTITTEMNRLENSLAMTKRTIRKPKHFIDENQSNNTPVSDDSNTNHHNLINNDSNVRPTFNNNPDSGFINTLRYGMLAVRLLPQSSISNLIVITDGMITLADIQVLDSVLNQLRCISVACSFLHVSSQFHPHSGHGNVPYSELMQLIATATSGTYLNSFPKTTPNLVVNFYHDKFIMWSFKRGDNESSNNTTNLSCTPPRVRPGEWTVRNSNFYGNRQTQLVTKKQFSDHIQANLDNVVCCRLREGFIIEDIQFKDAGSSTVVPYMNNSSKLQLKLILPWTNHIYIEYDITVKWPPSVKKKIIPIVVEEKPELAEPSTSTSQPPASIQLDSLNIYYTVSVKGPYEFLHDITCTRTKKSQLLSKIPRQCQFHLSSCRSSSISVATATTTITRNLNLLTDRSYSSLEKKVSSKYRQALITRFWSTMHSIAQTDLLIKHLEAYSPSTGHLMNSENFNQPIEQNETQDQQFQKQENQQTVQIEPTSQVIQNLQVLETPQILQLDDSSVIPSNLNSSNSKTDTVFSTEKTEANLLSFLTSEVPNKSPLHNGVPLFYYLVTNSNTSFCLKQNQFKTDDQQQSYTDQQHQRFVDFWKPVCTLDPDTQWPKWFSTYRIGGGVLLLRHDRPLPQWFHKENMDIDSYQTLTCNKSSVALYTLLKQWCTFVLIDEHSYVKCLDQSETYTDDVSFCIARVSPRPPSCCCVVLHLAFQSCVPASVHHKIMDDLKKNIELLDSTTAVEQFSFEDNNQVTEDQENNKKKVKTITIEESLAPNKPSKHQRYVYLMDKPLEKILIRYERIPSEFTTVIFPDGSQPSSAITTINIQKSRSKLNIGLPHDTVHESSTGVESKPVSTTTTLSRYLYHKRWIWSSGCSRYSQCSNSVSQKLQLQLQLARTLSVLTRIRLREGFKFAHSSAGIINMVLEVDMIEGSPHCPSTPTSHCVIQYVLFPPNKLQKHQPKTYEYNSVFDQLNMENNDDESSSIMSVEEQQKFDKRQKQGRHIVSFAGDNNDCCSKHKMEDEYQLITECWIEPQHGTVVVNEKQNYNYMSGLMYEQLADALWQVDSDCIGSLFTFQHMQHMCMDQNILVSNPDIDLNKKRRQSKTVIIDAGRIYKLPFTFNLVNLLPKCRHHSSMTFNLFTVDHNDTAELNSAKDERKLNYILERSFYSRLRTYNNRSFDVNDSDISVDMNQTLNDQEIGQCFIKRVNDTRLILTVGPSLIEEKCNITDNSSEDNLQPFGRSRANTWHYTKRGTGQSLLSTQSQENSTHYYRTMSVGSKPYYKDSEDLSWAQLRLEQNFSTAEIKHNSYLSDIGTDGQDYPTHMFIDVYDCRQEDVENVLMSDCSSFDHSLTDDYSEESSSYDSTETNSDEEEEEKNIISNREQINYDDPPVDPMFLEKYLYKIRVIYDRSLVTTVFQALHLGLNVRYVDIQRAVDRCQHRLISFDITDYIKVVCDHFKKNTDSCSICPADNTTLKSHHDMIHSKFSATLDRHMLKPVVNHQDYYFYDLIDDLDCDEYTNSNRRQKYLTNILLGETYHKTDFDTHELDEQDIFPLFVHLVCTIKTNTVTKSQSVRSLPTCILELINQDNDDETSKNMDFSNIKVSLDVYCLMLPINVYDDDDDDDDDEVDKYTTMNSSEQLHFPINNKSTILQSSKQTDDHDENSFVYLSSSLPPRHAQGLAAFLAEVEWCMRDEMAAGLLLYPTVTTNSLEKIIEHVTNSPQSPSNDHQQIPVHFVVPSSRPSKYNSVSLFLQKLDQFDIILDNDNGSEHYALEQSTKDTFYVVEKYLHPSPDSTVFESNSDDLENSPGSDEFLSDTNDSKPILPNFWIILKIQPDQQCQKEHKSDNNNTVNTLVVNVYFHCRFSESNVQGKYSAIMEIVKQNVYQAATVVNQTILLCRLYETKTCDPLLEPIIEDHDHSDDGGDENGVGEGKKIINYFTLGQFKCPVVWSTRFSLHPRLQRATAMGLLGIQVLHTMLEGFSVRNRRNMFVYKESSGSVFYLRIYENSSQQQQDQKLNNNLVYPLQYDSDDDDTISRCSSATSTTITSTIFSSNQSNFSRKYSEDINYIDNNKSIQNPGTRSLGGYWGDIDSKDVEDLTLKVHGISPVGDEIRIDLVRVLQNRLNDGVLELLTTMLYRNPLCRLYPDDVRFVQPSNGHPDYTMKLSLPIETKITKLFIHNLKRNAATLLLFPPQYASRHHRFNYAYDMINETKKPIIRSFFMYNQPIAGTSVIGGKRITSGKRGLACVLFDIYSNEDHESIDYLYDYPTDPELFERHTYATCIDDLKSTTEYSGYIKLFVWWRGRDNMEVLQQKLTSTVTYSLWDIYIERFLWEQPLIIEQPSEIYVNPLCIQFLAKWIAFGAHKSVPLAYYSKILCRIHISHVLREFKTHLSWSWLSSSNNLPISVRYFYIPRTKYGETSVDCVSNNVISDSADPLQLQKEHDSSLNNLMFYEWQVPDTDSLVCPPSAACVLIVVSVTSTKNKQKRKRQQNLNMGNEHSDSDADNGFVVPENHENINTVEDNVEILVTDDQPVTLNNDGDENVIQNTVTDTNKYQKPQKVNTCEKISKLFLLAISGQSVHSLSYSCHKNEDQPIAIQRLSRWLEWRNIAFTSTIYHMIGLRNSKIYGQFGSTQIKNQSSKINNNLDLLLDYKTYAAVVGEHETYEKIFVEKNFRINNRGSKPLDNDIEDKKNKPLNYKKDVLDSYIERLVRNSKQRRRTEMYQKLLYDMWIQVDAVVTKEAFRTFYQHSRLIHYCLTPLLFLPWWRLESAATRDHLVDASKLRSLTFSHAPQWHKRLCARLTVAYAQYIETDPLFSGFQPIQIGKSRVYNDGMIMDLDCTKSITRYYKKTIPGSSGGLLLIEIGVCQPFYYIKLSCIERARITSLVENYKDKCKPYCLLEQSENIIQNMHLHSFTYDFHVRILSDRLSKLVEKQKAGKRCNYGCDILMLLDHKNSIQNSANKTGNSNKKNAIAGFLDDFLKYYTLPPLYSNCLVLAGVIKRSEISVTGLQLYEYLVENCSEDCEGMAVLKIGDSSSAEDDDGASLFDDFEDHEFLDSQHIFGNDLTDYILVHHMAGSDIQRRQELKKNNSNTRKLGMESDDFFTDNQYEVCGLFDATLVMTLSSVKQLLLDTSNEITLSYYVLLTNNENYNLKKQKAISLKTIYNTQQRHSTPIRPSDRRFNQSNNQLLSASVPSNSVGNSLTSESTTCGGSLDENNTFQNWSELPPNHLPYFKKKYKKNNEYVYDDLNEHHQQTIKKRNLIKFYEKKAAELVAHTVDTAANRCRIHLLWKLFGVPIDQQKLGITDVTFNQLEELVNTAVFVKSLCEYDINYRHILKLLHKQPQWFTSLHKMISGQSTLLLETTSTLPPQCRIYNSNRSENQYIVVLPNLTEFDEFDAFVIIDNGIDSTEKLVSSSDSLVNIVFRRNVSGSDEVAALVETVGDAICYLIWQSIK